MLREELGYFTHMFHNWPLIIVGDYNSNLWLICYLYGKYRIHAKLSSHAAIILPLFIHFCGFSNFKYWLVALKKCFLKENGHK